MSKKKPAESKGVEIANALEPMACPAVRTLEQARALPEVTADAPTHPCTFETDTIESFAADDGRTMRVVMAPFDGETGDVVFAPAAQPVQEA